MTDNSTLLDDLDFAAKLAKDGAATPLLGGPFLLMWSALLIPTLIFHGLTLMDKTPLPIEKIGLVWFAYGLIGAVLSFILGATFIRKTGSNSFLNQLGRYVGLSTGLIIFAFAVAVVIAVQMGVLDNDGYNHIIPFAFGVSTLNLAVLGAMSRKSYLRAAAFIAGSMMVITLLLIRQPALYFVAALGVFLTMTLPGYLELRGETQHG